MITKTATISDCCRRYYVPFQNARSAFEAYLKSLKLTRGERVLLPAYIGWSPNEGSGVFDPIATLELDHAFYRVDERLRIDLNHLRNVLKEGRRDVVLLVHYFGYVDPGYEDAVLLAREHGAVVVEDEAHGMLTDLIGGLAGRLGDVAIFSMHKMLPCDGGGMLAFVTEPGESFQRNLTTETPWRYDLAEIARRRHSNAILLDTLITPLRDEIEPLWGAPRSAEIPQTYPILIRRASRDGIYRHMNASGFGVVSLYHTLVDRISPRQFPLSAVLARQILNLPVHQDVRAEQLSGMIRALGHSIRLCSAA